LFRHFKERLKVNTLVNCFTNLSTLFWFVK
jgi:hypothetical protein